MELLKKIGNFVWSRIFLYNFLALVVLYALLFYGLQGCLSYVTNNGQEVEVPNLIGKNSNNVASLLEDTGLEYEVLDSIYDPSKVQGTILDQDPKPTSVSKLMVKEGRKVKLRVSKRTMMVEMPDLIDKSQRFAEGVLRNREFRYTISYVPSQEAAGAVLEQWYQGKRVDGGKKIPIGSKIKLVVGRNEVGIPQDLPNLYGLSIVEARRQVGRMINMDFQVGACEGCVTAADSSIARVYVQSPEFEEGARVASGGSIVVVAKKDFDEPQ